MRVDSAWMFKAMIMPGYVLVMEKSGCVFDLPVVMDRSAFIPAARCSDGSW